MVLPSSVSLTFEKTSVSKPSTDPLTPATVKLDSKSLVISVDPGVENLVQAVVVPQDNGILLIHSMNQSRLRNKRIRKEERAKG